MAAERSEQPAPPAPMSEAEFMAWMARLGFPLTDAQAREMFSAYQLLARMKESVRSDRGFGIEAPSLPSPESRGG